MSKQNKRYTKATYQLAVLVLCAALLTGCSGATKYFEDLGLTDSYEADEAASSSLFEKIPESEADQIAAINASADIASSILDANKPSDKPESSLPSDAVGAGLSASLGVSDRAALEAFDESNSAASSSSSDPNRSEADHKTSSSVEVIKDASSLQQSRETIGLTDEAIASLKASQQGLYAYDHLTDQGKTLYVEILQIMRSHASNIVISTLDPGALDTVFNYCMADHPEIFYVDGYQYTNYSVGGVVTSMAFTGRYTYTEDEVAQKQLQVNNYVQKCLEDAPGGDDYSKIKYVYDYIVTHTDYDEKAADNQNILSVFIGGKSVCQGYAKATQYLLQKMGISSTLVSGTVSTRSASGVRHAWNLCLADGAYYYVDTTWGDASYQSSSGEEGTLGKVPAVNYDYLCVTTEEISKTHTVSDILKMPECTAIADNYYVRENEYFTTADFDHLSELFTRKYQSDSDQVAIKCASDEVYNAMYDNLITQKKIFDYLKGDTSTVSYTAFENTRIMIFWL